ncbi:MAG: restriction endonuclease subunit S [Candidatus Brocadiia bacterium]
MSKRNDLPDKLPDHWTWSTFGEMADYINGYGFSKSEWDEDGRPIIRIQNLTGTGDSFNYFSGEIEDKYVVYPGDLLISWSATLGAYIWHGEEAVLNQHIYKVEPHYHVDKKYLYYVAHFSDDELMRRSHGSGMKHVTKDVFNNFPIPLPPLPEQRRIVARIEELFSNLDAGLNDLETTGRQLDRYRQSVLQAAVEGRLTADWRRTHDPEPADQLVERILQERRKQWEEDYRAKYEAKGKEPPSGWKSRYSEAEEPQPKSEMPSLPDSWQWVSLDQMLLEDLRNGKSVRSKDGGFPVMRLTAINNGTIDTSECKDGDWTKTEAEKFIIKQDDFFVARGNGSLSLVGRGGLVTQEPKQVAFPDTMIRVRVNAQFFQSQFLRIIWDSRVVRDQIESAARTSAGIYKINQGDLRNTVLPLPPLAEQKQIVAEVERLLSVADDTSYTVDREQSRARRLRQSILKQAFSGRLVSHEKSKHQA